MGKRVTGPRWCLMGATGNYLAALSVLGDKVGNGWSSDRADAINFSSRGLAKSWQMSLARVGVFTILKPWQP